MRVSIGATLHGIVEGNLPCGEYGSDNCETAQTIGMDCCAECCFEEVFHRQDDRASNKTRRIPFQDFRKPLIDCSIDIVGENEGVDGIVLYDASKKPRLVVENINGKLTIHVWENADEDIPTTSIAIS